MCGFHPDDHDAAAHWGEDIITLSARFANVCPSIAGALPFRSF